MNFNDILVAIDDFVWGVPLMVLILVGGLLSLSGTVSDILPLNIIISETAIKFTSSSGLTDASMNYRLTGAIFNIIASVALHFPMKFLINKKINLK